MAFAQNELSLHSYNGAQFNASTGAGVPFRQYVYTNSAADNVTAAGFFNPAADDLSVGNTIYVINTGITYRVTVISSAGVVTVAANYAAPQ